MMLLDENSISIGNKYLINNELFIYYNVPLNHQNFVEFFYFIELYTYNMVDLQKKCFNLKKLNLYR